MLKRSTVSQNFVILGASYLFYGWFDKTFLLILVGVTLVSYLGSLLIERAPDRKKIWLTLGIFFVGSCLALMKYYNFFVDSISSATSIFGYTIHLDTVKLLLPIGLSYYVFQTIGYMVDVYRGKIKAEKNALNYFAYVSFFPSILSGPIAQATKVLPQFSAPRQLNFENAKIGCELILWGLFKKVVVADTLAKQVNYIFSSYSDLSGSVLAVGIVLYSIQLYADFSGYSEMAQGIAKLLGFDLMQNFKYPYFSRNVGEFWRNWHRSLSTWMRDYIYIPLGGRGNSKWIYCRNILITFTFSGLWHGASWNFVIWGFINGLYFLPLIFTNRLKKHDEPIAHNRLFPNFTEIYQIILTFTLISLSRVFFRTPDLTTAFGFFQTLFSKSLFTIPDVNFKPFVWVIVLLVVEWWQREKNSGLELSNFHFALRYPAYISALAAIIMAFSQGNNKEYLYFKF